MHYHPSGDLIPTPWSYPSTGLGSDWVMLLCPVLTRSYRIASDNLVFIRHRTG